MEDQVKYFANYNEFTSASFQGQNNANCWSRNLEGDFSEIVAKIDIQENIVAIDEQELLNLQLTNQGELARSILLNDLKLLKDLGACPTLNLIKNYDRDDSYPFFPTDVYSFHVDRSPVPIDTILCTYYGESSEIIPNSATTQKILIPEIRNELQKLYDGPTDGFEDFLIEYFFDLHYLPKEESKIITLGKGNLWRLATDHPESKVPPCVHRAPEETSGKTRLMMIC